MKHGNSAVVTKTFQFLLLSLFAGACLALAAGAALAAPYHDHDIKVHGGKGHDGKHRRGSLALPVTGTFAPSVASGPLSSLGSGTFSGSFNVQRFERRNLQVVAIGTVVVALTDSTGNVVRTVVRPGVALPLTLTAQVPGSATVTLPLGPVSVDSGGLTINLNATSVTITDQGYLLETLLNDLATLLTNLVTGVAELVVVVIDGLVALLNAILGALI